MWLLLTLTPSALAEMWCANELAVHEWGAYVLLPDRDPLPQHLHRGEVAKGSALPPGSVRALPADSGMREKPVVNFHAAPGDTPIPVAVTVGFPEGPAAWYPQATGMPSVRTLTWDPLTLTAEPRHPLPDTEAAWIQAERTLPGTLYVNTRSESERFLFYEGADATGPAVQLDGDRVRNGGVHPVHDLVLVQPDGTWAWAEQVSSNAQATLTPGSGPLRDTLMARWSLPEFQVQNDWSAGCVDGRNPREGVSTTSDHRLRADEVALLLDTWSLDHPDQPLLIYREDTRTLDQVLPVTVYTDMYHWVTLRRLSVVVAPAQGRRIPPGVRR